MPLARSSAHRSDRRPALRLAGRLSRRAQAAGFLATGGAYSPQRRHAGQPVCGVPHAQDRDNHRRRQSARAHLCIHHPGHDRQIQNPQPMYVVSCRQVRSLGNRGSASLARTLSVACRLKRPCSLPAQNLGGSTRETVAKANSLSVAIPRIGCPPDSSIVVTASARSSTDPAPAVD
jgi:hypothetical protein